jgi:glycosyltransferase involved in cell wall biosynthesis
MKLAYLTAGAAGMYCGSCLHDNALAKQFLERGHECLLIPVYTPIRTDEEDVSIDKVFMGGINVYLQQKMPWLAYLPRWLDSFLNQPWLIKPLTKNAGKTSASLLGALTVSMLRGTAGRQRKEFLRLLDWLESDVKPDVVVLTNLLIGGGIPDIKKRLGVKVFVTLQGDDIFIDSLPAMHRATTIELMRGLVSEVDGFIVHTMEYGRRMGQLLAIPESKVHVVPLGIQLQNLGLDTMGEPSPSVLSGDFTIGYFARMAPEKGLHRIVDAFIRVANQPGAEHSRLRLAGWMGPQHEEYWSEQKRKLSDAGLNARWDYVGSIDRKEKGAFLASLHLFCVPTTYAEPKALFLLEAVAAGVPYLQPDHGAFPELHARLKSVSPHTEVGDLFVHDSEVDLEEKLLHAIKQRRGRHPVPGALLTEIGIQQHAVRIEKILQA